MNYAPLLVGLLAAIALAIAFAGGAFLGHWLTGRRRYDEGHRAGHAEGYAAMKREHEQYRAQNRVALRAIQNLTPDAPVATLGPSLEQPRTFDTSGAFDCHVETTRGKQAVGRGRTLEDARNSAKRYLERSRQTSTVIITQPGPHGSRVEVERIDRLADKPEELAIARRCTAELQGGSDRAPRQCMLAIGHLESHNFGDA